MGMGRVNTSGFVPIQSQTRLQRLLATKDPQVDPTSQEIAATGVVNNMDSYVPQQHSFMALGYPCRWQQLVKWMAIVMKNRLSMAIDLRPNLLTKTNSIKSDPVQDRNQVRVSWEWRDRHKLV